MARTRSRVHTRPRQLKTYFFCVSSPTFSAAFPAAALPAAALSSCRFLQALSSDFGPEELNSCIWCSPSHPKQNALPGVTTWREETQPESQKTQLWSAATCSGTRSSRRITRLTPDLPTSRSSKDVCEPWSRSAREFPHPSSKAVILLCNCNQPLNREEERNAVNNPKSLV